MTEPIIEHIPRKVIIEPARTIYRCPICNTQYDDLDEAKQCAAAPLIPQCYQRGDVVYVGCHYDNPGDGFTFACATVESVGSLELIEDLHGIRHEFTYSLDRSIRVDKHWEIGDSTLSMYDSTYYYRHAYQHELLQVGDTFQHLDWLKESVIAERIVSEEDAAKARGAM